MLALIDKVQLFVVVGGVELRLGLDSYRKEAKHRKGKQQSTHGIDAMRNMNA